MSKTPLRNTSTLLGLVAREEESEEQEDLRAKQDEVRKRQLERENVVLPKKRKKKHTAVKRKIPDPERFVDEDGYSYEVYAEYSDDDPRKKKLKAPTPRARRNRYASRASGISTMLLTTLNGDELSNRLIEIQAPIFGGEMRPFWFGFEDLDYFANVTQATRILTYLCTGTFDWPLIEGVLLPIIKDIMMASYPVEDEFMRGHLVRVCSRYIWDWHNQPDPSEYYAAIEEVMRLFPGKEAVMRGFISAAKEVVGFLRTKISHAYMLLQLLEMSSRRAVWRPPDSLLNLRSRVYLPVLGAAPVDESFTQFARQLFLERQIRLQSGTNRVELEPMDFGPHASELDSIVRNRDSILIMFRYHFNIYTYFLSARDLLISRLEQDFAESATGNLGSKALQAWRYFTLDNNSIQLAPSIAEIDNLLGAHVGHVMAQKFKYSGRSRTTVPLRLTAYIPEVEVRKATTEQRKIRQIEQFEKNLAIQEGRPAPEPDALLRDLSPRRRRRVITLSKAGHPPRRVDLTMLTTLSPKVLDMRNQGTLRLEPLSGSAGKSHSADSHSGSVSLGRVVVSEDESSSRDNAPVRKRGRPKGSKNRPKVGVFVP